MGGGAMKAAAQGAHRSGPVPAPMAGDSERIEAVMPHSPDAERALVAALIVVNDYQAEEVAYARGRLVPEDFYLPKWRAVFEAICALNDKGAAINIVSVLGELERAGKCPGVVTKSELRDLPQATFTNAHVKAHADLVFEKSALRQVILGCGDMVQRCRTAPGELSDLLDSGLALFGGISARDTATGRTAGDAMVDALKQMDDYRANRGKPKLSWGFPTLDSLTGGLRAGDNNIIAGWTGIGKTSLALNVVLSLAKQRIPVAIFSLEMSELDICEALVCIEAGIDGLALVSGKLSDADYVKATEAAGRIAEWPIRIEDQRDLGTHQLRARLMRLSRAHGVKVAVVDYLQLMHPPKTQNREQAVAALSRGCKIAAQESGVALLVLSQLSRNSAKEKREPELHDLRDSGCIEQDADAVIFVHRPYRIDDKADRHAAELILRKQRKGPENERIACHYTPSCRRFRERQDRGAV